MSTKALCIHGHFYQPPREDPFSGLIPVEEGAKPFANYNEKVAAECYEPNARMDNFSLLSFNFGPTLAACCSAMTARLITASSKQTVAM